MLTRKLWLKPSYFQTGENDLNSSVSYCSDVRGVSGAPLVGSPDAEKRKSLGRLVRLIVVEISQGLELHHFQFAFYQLIIWFQP